MNFKEIYKFPLSTDSFGNKVFTSDHSMAFDFMEISHKSYGEYLPISEADQKKIVGILNEKGLFELKTKYKFEYLENSAMIRIDYNGKFLNFIQIRGWGNLTGIGGLNLKPEIAKEYQNRFAEFIIQKLS